MTPISPEEYVVIEKLIAEAEDAMADMATVLGGEDPVVQEVLTARDWLRGLRDAGQWCAYSYPSHHPRAQER